MQGKVFPNVPSGSVLVLDRATYHQKLTENSKLASSNYTKQQFAEWLVEKKVKVKKMTTVEDFLTLKRVELAALCKKHKLEPIYEVVKLAKKYKLKILFFPVAHPELNSIEMIWAMLKKFLKQMNANKSLPEAEKWANEFFDSFDDVKGRNVLSM